MMKNLTGNLNSTAARDLAYCLHPTTNLKQHLEKGPLVISHGDGVRVFDIDGRSYIEGFAGLWCASLGFSEERVIAAVAAQMKRLPFYHGMFGRSHEPSIDLAEKLVALAPVPMSKVFFANSGSEANDTAMKLVWYYNNAIGRPEKKKIISRLGGYHGVTIGAGSLTGLPNFHRDFDLPIPNILHTDCPHYYRFGAEGETEEDFAQRCADNLEKLILAEGPETVAAFIVEPVMGTGGVIVPPAGYFEKAQKVLKTYDVLLIADEVICGFGRTGNMWGSDTFALKPDILTTAKALSAAYMPISAVMISDPIFQSLVEQSAKIGVFGHGFTYSGHPVAAAAALETIKIYEERNIIKHVRKVSQHFQRALRQFAEHPLVGEVRGIGLMAAVELVSDKATKEQFPPELGVGALVAEKGLQHGVMFRVAAGDALLFSPPLIITEEEVDLLFDGFGKALDDTYAKIKAKV